MTSTSRSSKPTNSRASGKTPAPVVQGSAAYQNREKIREEIAASIESMLVSHEAIALVIKSISSDGPLGGTSHRVVAGTVQGLGVIISVYCDTRSDDVLRQEIAIEENRLEILEQVQGVAKQ